MFKYDRSLFSTTVFANKFTVINTDILRLAHEICKDKTEIAKYKSCNE